MSNSTKCLITSFTIAVTILLMSAIWSCGKRITSTTRTEIKNDSLRIENSIELTQNTTMASIGTLQPLDNSKPMIIDGKKYFNVSIEFKKSLNGELNIKSKESLSYEGSESEAKNKETQKTDYSNIWIGLSAVIGILFVLYITLKKYIP